MKMHRYEGLLDTRYEVPNQADAVSALSPFTKFIHRARNATRRSKSRHSQSHTGTSTDKSEDNGSENSQILYMADSKRSRRGVGQSLSAMSNGSNRRYHGHSNSKDEPGVDVEAGEQAWSVIDREIHEWQYVCRTGRPYWWSPESKASRLQKLPQWHLTELSPRIWVRELDDDLKPAYESRRRAVSDSYLTDPNTMQDLAHIVAIQLLGACFTLPPDQISGEYPPANYTSSDEHDFSNTPDPRMISSLRLHTHFRYSPCFGHQARNTSPVQIWPGKYDGPSPAAASPAFDATGIQTPVIVTSEIAGRGRRVHRALNPTESSPGSSCSLESHRDDLSRSSNCTLDSSVTGTAWSSGKGGKNVHHTESTKEKQSASGHRRRPLASPLYTLKGNDDIDIAKAYRGVTPSKPPASNYTLQPVIRSEPHHVFIQPVRELVVKRWRSMRRRFRGSLHSPLPANGSEFGSLSSGSGASSASSPRLSSDARSRRRMARERGEIHSSSMESSPHYNTPNSGLMSPDESGTPAWKNSSRNIPVLSLADSLVAAAEGHATQQSPSSVDSLLPSWESNLVRSQPLEPSLAQRRTSATRNEAGFFIQPKADSASCTPSFSPRKSPRQRRKSTLSEVYTPDDVTQIKPRIEVDHDRSILGAVGSAITSPIQGMEEILSIGSTVQAAENPSGPASLSDPPSKNLSPIKAARRPGVARTSSSGTQIFKPAEEGIELDGLPVGPGKELWDPPVNSKGKRRERTYL